MSYTALIAKLSLKFKWPAWVIYDNAFHQEAADTGNTDWSKVDPILHTQCFHGMALRQEGWCSLCHSIAHLKESYPLRPPDAGGKHPGSRPPDPKRPKTVQDTPLICGNYNSNPEGKCRFFPKCNYRHICRDCQGPHPRPKCPLHSRPPPQALECSIHG